MFRTLYERFTSGAPVEEKPKTKITRRHFPSVYPDDALIGVLKEGNPRRPNTAAHAAYEVMTGAGQALTVREALDRNVTYADIDYAVKKGYVNVV